MSFAEIISAIDDFVWGPVMLVLLVGTGIFLTIRLKFRPWRNLGYALKSTLSKEARTTSRGTGDVSPFSALTTALAATIGTGNIVGVATAMVAGGPGALVWMWISACFGLTSKFSECMLAIKYREVNEKGEMSGGPMYTMKKGFKNKKLGAFLGMLFAVFAVIASFGIGNMTQANSISESLNSTFGFSPTVVGIVLTVLALVIIVGGIKTISKVSSVVVPLMAVFYIIAGLVVIVINIQNVPAGMAMIFKMAFSFDAVGGGLCGAITAAMMNAMRYGVARGVFSNEAGMGSAAITAAAATTDDPVRQGYINMTGTFWDTIVVCTITGLCIASSGVLGMTDTAVKGTYDVVANNIIVVAQDSENKKVSADYTYELEGENLILTYVDDQKEKQTVELSYADKQKAPSTIEGTWNDASGNEYIFENGKYEYNEVVKGAALTIAAFSSALGKIGGYLVTIGIALFAFSTILGWEYHGEKAFEYIFNTHKYNMLYRIFFSLIVFVGATTALDIVWNFSDIANALMAIPNLICMLALSGVIAKEVERFQPEIDKIKKEKKNK
ncbi:sodium:alanine symporter family protein [uncultured Eubacterium sp.]|uniref:alanine/glycine:cation symporter family protein n=1 Tax=uncultured Eubacterium sp. TaxID=165185 RepID=UPI002670DD8D|nr:sodium:alanine symporter family protein [uncultured Eubacterium sp.]